MKEIEETNNYNYILTAHLRSTIHILLLWKAWVVVED